MSQECVPSCLGERLGDGVETEAIPRTGTGLGVGGGGEALPALGTKHTSEPTPSYILMR